MVAVMSDETQRGQNRDSRDFLIPSVEQERSIVDLFQRSLSPEWEMAFSSLEVATLCEPAPAEVNVGGDFCDAFALNAGKVALLVGDVCGKGLQAALYASQLKHALRAYLRESPYPTQALARLNRFVCDTQRLDGRGDEIFAVMALAVVDPASGDAVLSVAGAEPPLFLRSSGETEAVTTTGNLPLGVEPREVYAAVTLRLLRGDTLLLATDGITEARCGNDFLGYEGMVALAEDAADLQSLRECARTIIEGARTFANGPLHDDACLLLARRRSELS